MDNNIFAELVWDGVNSPVVPARLGVPKSHHLKGTPLENLCEIAMRVCYDSFNTEKSRGSVDAHKHLLEVKHWSIYEHAYFTVELNRSATDPSDLTPSFDQIVNVLVNRPGLHITSTNDYGLQVTLNFRHILEWFDWDKFTLDYALNSIVDVSNAVYNVVLGHAKTLAPVVFQHCIEVPTRYAKSLKGALKTPQLSHYPELRRFTFLLGGSRGFSHELVRHRFPVSQRSTRYVDEHESPWVEHPLMSAFLSDTNVSYKKKRAAAAERNAALVNQARDVYRATVDDLQGWLIAGGVDKHAARKQARGAARGYLGNALATELVFTISFTTLIHILGLRASEHADAEIRAVAMALYNTINKSPELKSLISIILHKEASPDGLGDIVKVTAPSEISTAESATEETSSSSVGLV